MINVRIPASAGNLGSGFDVIGLAVKLYINISIKRRNDKKQIFKFTGEGKECISAENNLFFKVIRQIFDERSKEAPGFSLEIHNSIPVRRGLGSSGTHILAGVVAANYLGNFNMSEKEILSAAIGIEGPPDNINSQMCGGLTSSLVLEDGTVEYKRRSFPAEIKIILSIPDVHVSTKDARRILPKKYSLPQVIFNMQRVALFFEAIRDKDYSLLSHLLHDKIHQPFRTTLVPGQDEILKMSPQNGLIGTFISGSGSTVCALALENVRDIAQMMSDTFRKNGIQSKTVITNADNKGIYIKSINTGNS